MKTIILILSKTILTFMIDILLAMLLALLAVYLIEIIDKKTISIIITVLIGGSYVLYLLFGNTKFISLSCLLLNYRLKTDNHHVLRIVGANIITYLLWFGSFWFQEEYPVVLSFLLLIDLGGCFIPKINNRIVLYLLKIRFEAPLKKPLPNDGILL